MNRGKLKSRGGAKKRFRLTASGKVKRHKANHSHILTKKNAKRKRHLTTASYVSKSEADRIRKLVG